MFSISFSLNFHRSLDGASSAGMPPKNKSMIDLFYVLDCLLELLAIWLEKEGTNGRTDEPTNNLLREEFRG